MKKILLIFLVTILFGCAPKWSHPSGYSRDVLDADIASCKSEGLAYASERLYDPNHPKGPKAWRYAYKMNYINRFNECMDKKGWKPAK